MPSFPTLACLIAPLGLLGCTAYSPGSFTQAGQAFRGQTLTLDCLDLAIAGGQDAIAPGPIVDYQFGNRCDHPVKVDLNAVRATGRTSAGAEVALVPYDPYRGLKPLRLEARTAGRERLEYRIAADLGTDLISVCVALDGITGGAPTGARVCVDAGGRVAAVAQ